MRVVIGERDAAIIMAGRPDGGGSVQGRAAVVGIGSFARSSSGARWFSAIVSTLSLDLRQDYDIFVSNGALLEYSLYAKTKKLQQLFVYFCSFWFI
ncbi:MAG: hypothetical protein V4578_08685 [Pseudomonadota bacterium]